MIPLSSRDNPLVKRARALAHSARDRRKLGQTVLDGAHLIGAALDAGMALDALLVSERGQGSEEHRALLARAPAGCTVACLPDALFAQISAVDAPSGLMALIDTPAVAPPQALTGSVLVLDGVQDSGNLGALLRTAAAAGIRSALLSPECANAWSPRVLRAAIGAHFAVSVFEGCDLVALLRAYRDAIIVTALGDDATPLFDAVLRTDVAWVFGAEGGGVSAPVQALATRRVQIPMPGAMESLNVAAAAAVCLFEQVRQRQR